MLREKLLDLVNNYPDFPKEGINFKDIMPALRSPEIFKDLIYAISISQPCLSSEAIIAVDARGFIFGSCVAFNLNKPLIVARKPGKLPGEVITGKYDLEYGSNSLSIQKEAIKEFNTFVIIDDLLATGGTVKCISELLKKEDKKIKGLEVVIELSELSGRDIFDFPVNSQLII